MRKKSLFMIITALLASSLWACGPAPAAQEAPAETAKTEETQADSDTADAAPANETAESADAAADTAAADTATADTAAADTAATDTAATDTAAETAATSLEAADDAESAAVAEEPTGAASIPVYTINEVTENDWKEYTRIAYGSWETMTLTEAAASACPALSASLSMLNDKLAVDAGKQYKEIEDAAEEMWSSLAESERETFPTGELDARIEHVRCDSKVLSFYNTTFVFYPGAAHGFTASTGYSFDTASGAAIALSDVIKDREGLYDAVKNNLRTVYDGEPVTDSGDILTQYFTEAEDRLIWVLDREGVTFRFPPGELTSYAVGMIEAHIRFADYPDLFTDKYGPHTGAYVQTLSPYYRTEVDFDGDGEKTVVMVDGDIVDEDNPYAYDTVNVHIGDAICKTEQYHYGMQAVLLHTEDGRDYIYVVTGSDNDYETLLVFSVTDGTPALVGTMERSGFAGTYLEGNGDTMRIELRPILDPACFALDTRMDLMSTYGAQRTYAVGSDGMPQPLTDYYEIPEKRQLTSKVVLTAELVDPQTGAATDESVELPAGTACLLWHTNGVDTVDLMLDDGRAVRVNVKREWPQTVNGIELEEAFDGTMFAG